MAVGGAAGASDETTAKSLVITQADVAKAHVGGGFKALPSSGDTTDDTSSETFELLAECVGKPVPDRAVVANAHGPELIDRSGHTQIASFVDIVQTKTMAKADRAVVQDPGFPRCIGQLAEQQGAASGLTSANAERATVKRFGDYSTAVLIDAKGTSNGQPSRLIAIDVLTQRGRAELTAEFLTDRATPYDRVSAEKIIARLEKRLRKAKV
jgi:hypothetical protein